MKRHCISLLLAVILSSALQAQRDDNKKLLQKLVEKEILTQNEADDIMQESTGDTDHSGIDKMEATTAKVRNIFNNTPYLQVGGYGLFLYRYSHVEDIKHDAKARVLFLHARGQLTNTLSYFFMTEFVNPMLYEYYADWTPTNEINVRMGQFKVPFTLENPISVSNLETIYNTRSVSALAGMRDDVMYYQNDQNNSGRDIGVQMSGMLFNNLIDYKAGIFQGSGMNTSDKDNTKNFAGTLLIQPVNGFRIGGSAVLGEATYRLPNETEEHTHVRNRWALSGDYDSERLYVRAEWLRGKDGKIDKEGLYGMVKYYIVPTTLNVIGSIDYYNQDRKTNNEVADYLIGADYYFYKNCRIQINYLYSDYSKIWDQKNSHQLMGQLQFVF